MNIEAIYHPLTPLGAFPYRALNTRENNAGLENPVANATSRMVISE